MFDGANGVDLSVQLIAFNGYCFFILSSYYLYRDFFGFAARLDVYIYDYLVKKKLHNTAKAFMTEGKVSPDPVGER